MAYLGRFQRPDAATSPKEIINRARPLARGFAFFFFTFFFFPLFLFLDKIQEEMDKSCLLFGVCGERKGIPVSDSCGLI